MSDSAPREPRRDLDELIAQFEDEVRKRPTPAEIAEAEKVEAADAPAVAKQAAPPVTATPAQSSVEAEFDLTPVTAPAPAIAPMASAPAKAQPPPAALEDLQTWWAGGGRVELELAGGQKRTIFTRVLGDGPWLTMIHGFPHVLPGTGRPWRRRLPPGTGC